MMEDIKRFNILEFKPDKIVFSTIEEMEGAYKALKNAQIKFINAGAPTSILDLFSPAGGAQLGGMLTALQAANPEVYQTLVKALEGLPSVKKGSK